MTKTAVKYGSLSEFEMDANGFAFFGAGNLARSGWHGAQNYSAPGLAQAWQAFFRGDWNGVRDAFTQKLTESVAAKVHYRTGDDIAPANSSGNKYVVDGGHQQDGAHSASGTNVNRASWNVDFSFFDLKGDFSGAFIKIDLDPTARKDFLDFHYDDDIGRFVAIDDDGNLRFLDTGVGNGAKAGDVLQDSINLMFFNDLIDNDGNAGNGIQAWDMEHGQFDFEFGQTIDGPLPFFPNFGLRELSTSVQVNVGPMIEIA